MRNRLALIVPAISLAFAAAPALARTASHPRHHQAAAATPKTPHERTARPSRASTFGIDPAGDPFAQAASSGLIQPRARKNGSDVSAFSSKPHRPSRSASY
ncbi:MAG: hypothetical protein JNL41_03780 [Phenylobacterium sp.]|uniref:hypothetical protein n=1 Tax=Phenylobacterium sp. TaxID=1871053 RepID=UPI001A4849BA|nr:hypothetical protein [Phenylobacterium sp.]MBL8553374.1 hypothetical protein [Phenylobacterium sp.]